MRTAAILITLGLSLSLGRAQGPLPIEGKGMYLWQLWTANGGGKNLNTVIANLQRVGATWVVIKMADGDSYYNSPNHSLYNWVVPNYGSMDSVIALLHGAGIQLLAFQYVYGAPHHWGNPASETDVANSILDVKGIDGLLIDAEIQYDTLSNRAAAAKAYCDTIRAHHPGAFIGLTAWARINGHSTFPWTAFLDRVAVNMPQTYWAARPLSPLNELNLMSSQFASATQTWVSQGDTAAAKPIMPLGQGEYFGYGSDVAQGDITSFANLSQSTYRYPGISLWEYNQITHSYVWDEYAAAWSTTGVPMAAQAPEQIQLSQNFPNPFNPSTVIRYRLPARAHVLLSVFNTLGQQVAVLADGEEEKGEHEVRFDGKNFASGVYLYRLSVSPQASRDLVTREPDGQAGPYMQTRKLVLLK